MGGGVKGGRKTGDGGSEATPKVRIHAMEMLLTVNLFIIYWRMKSFRVFITTVSVRWIQMIKESMKMAMQDYCSLRMVGEYEQHFYLPIARRFLELIENNGALAKNLGIQNDRIRRLWKDMRIDLPIQNRKGPYRVGKTFQVTAGVHLGQFEAR